MSQLDRDDIQGIIVGAYGDLPAARYVLLEIREPSAARSWLRKLSDEVYKMIDHSRKKEGPRVNVAFTYSGLFLEPLSAELRGLYERNWSNDDFQDYDGQSVVFYLHWRF